MIHASLPSHQDLYRDGCASCSSLTCTALATRSTRRHARSAAIFHDLHQMARLTWADFSLGCT
jgi:hypothetical protein